MAEIVEKPKAFTAQEVAKRVFRHENAVLIIILVGIMAAMAVVSKGLSISAGNLRNILVQSSTRGIAAIGELFVLLTAGIDLSVGGIALMSSLACASLITTGYQNLIGAPIPLGAGILLLVLVGLGVGAVNGLAVSRLGMSAVIVTLAMWIMSTGFGYLFCKGMTIQLLPRSLAFFGQGYIAGVPVPVIIFVVVAVVAYFVLNHTTFGRSVYAVGGNPVSAWLAGINVKNVLFLVLVISGFLGALAGLVIMSRTMVAGMLTGMGLELDAIAAVLVGGVSLAGGRGNLIGVVIGALIIGVINNGMNIVVVGPAYDDLVKGGIIFAAVAVDVRRRRR